MKHDHLHMLACRNDLLWRRIVFSRVSCENECGRDRGVSIREDQHAHRDAVCHPFVPSRCKYYCCHCHQLNCLACGGIEKRGLWIHARRRGFRAALITRMGAADTKLEATRYLWRRMRTGSEFWVRGGLAQNFFTCQSTESSETCTT